MYAIASNISTRMPEIARIFAEWKSLGWDVKSQPAAELKHIVEMCVQAGADAIEINLQQHDDHPEFMDAAVRLVQDTVKIPLCLSTNRPDTLTAGIKAAAVPLFINYISMDEVRLRDMFPLVVESKAKTIFLVSDAATPADSREMLERAAVLVGAANAAGITNDRILLDPGLIHITMGDGQRHLLEVREFLRGLADIFETPVGATCWLSSSSSGAPPELRPKIEAGLLTMLAGWGLSSVFINLLEIDNLRALHMIKIFNNECVYAENDIALAAK